MRGDTAVTMRLLLRGAGMAGLAAMLGGIAAVAATLLPWHELTTTVDMLGTTSQRTDATASALPEHWWGWGVLVAGAGAIWVGGGVAIDRPLRWARPALGGAALVLLVAAGAAFVAPPPAEALASGGAGATETGELLPTGVDLDVAVRISVGPWVTLVAAGLVAVGAVTHREG